MATANKNLLQPGYNTYVNTWGTGPLNDNFGNIDLALGGSTLLNATGLGGTTVVLTATQCIPLTISVSGSPGGIVTYSVPAGIGGQWIVRNGTADSSVIRFQSAAGGTYVSITSGDNVQVSCDGSATGMVRSTTAAAGAAGSNTQVQFNSSGVLAGSAGMVFDGTTLTVTGFNCTGGTVLGDASGDALTINSNAASIPNGLNIGSNNLYLNGTQVGIGTTTLGSDKLVVAGTIKSTAGGFVFPDGTTQTTSATAPAGSVIAFAGTGAVPSGWLYCDGTAVSRTTYAALFTAIGTTYGAGNGTTTFNLPDLRGRVIANVDGGTGRLPGFNSVGAAGGGATNTAVTNSSGNNVISVTSTQMDGPNSITTSAPGVGQDHAGPGHTHANVISSGNNAISVSGTSGAFSIVQSTMAMSYIIKT